MLVRQVPPFLHTLFSHQARSSDPASAFFPGVRVVRVVRVVRFSVVLSGSELPVTIVLVSPVSRVVFVMSKGRVHLEILKHPTPPCVQFVGHFRVH